MNCTCTVEWTLVGWDEIDPCDCDGICPIPRQNGTSLGQVLVLDCTGGS
jgi:hypothetical protein